MKKIFTLFCLLLTVNIGFAQTTVQIGTGTAASTSTLYSPLYRFSATSTTAGSRSLMIYTAAELAAAGINSGDIITELAFNKTIPGSFNSGVSYTMRMANSSLTAPLNIPAPNWPTIFGTQTVVLSSTNFNIPNAAGWTTFTLDNPFTYTGGTLEISTELDHPGIGSTDRFSWEYTAGFADYIVGEGVGSNTNLSTYKQRPNIKITYQLGVPCTNPPTAGASVVTPASLPCPNTTVVLSLNGNSIGSGQTYEWESSTDNITYTSMGPAQMGANKTITPTTTMWYRCKIECSGGTPVYSTPTQLTVAAGGLNGTYTINSALPTSGTNYQSFTDFATALDCGVTGPVVVNVEPGSGPYTERVEFPDIPGASAVNTVRLNGNGETIQFDGTSTADHRIVTLNGTQYFTLNNLKIKALSNTYGWGVHVTGTAERDSIINCEIDLSSITGTSSINASGIVVSGTATSATSASSVKHLYIGGNTVNAGSTAAGGGYYGITFSGTSSTSQNDSISIVGNEIYNFYYYGIRCTYVRGARINNNNVHRSTKTAISSACYGVYFYYCQGGEAIGNKLHDFAAPGVTSTSTLYAMYNYNYNNDAANPVLIANNLIYNLGNYVGLQYLLQATGPYQKVYNNTVNLDGVLGSSTSTIYGMYLTTNTGTEVKNNIVNIIEGNSGTKYGIYVSSASTPANLQKNNVNVFSTQSGAANAYYYGSAYATLAALQAAQPTLEVGSPSVTPQYTNVAMDDYTPMNTELISSGDDVYADVPFDINGVPRSPIPTIGAFEKLPSGQNDAAMVQVLNPLDPICATTAPVSVVIRNAGVNDITSLQINWTFNGVLQTPFNYTSTMTPVGAPSGQFMDTVNLGNIALTSGANQFEFWTSLPNGVADIQPNNDSLSHVINTVSFSINSVSDSICPTGMTSLTLVPNGPYPAGALEWQSSPDNSTWTAIPNSDAVTYLVDNIANTTYYRVKIDNQVVCYSSSKEVYVLPVIAPTVTDGERCGPGTVTLNASSVGGASINWYANATGGQPLGSGATFTTPSLTNTTTYYASTGAGGSSIPVASPSMGSSEFFTATAGWGLRFTVNNSVTIDQVSIKARGTAAGPATMQILITDLNDVTLYSGIVHNFNITTVSTSYNIPVNVAVPPGDYKMVMTSTGVSNLVRESGGVSFPYTDPNNTVSITAGANGAGSANTTSAYYWFYNWIISTGCESPRMPVVATINDLPNVDLGNDTAFCGGNSYTLDASVSGTATYLWNNGATTPTLNVSTAGEYSVIVDNGICEARDTIQVDVAPEPIINLPDTMISCAGVMIDIDAGNVGADYDWSTGETTQVISTNTAGTYTVEVTNVYGCSTKDTVEVVINPLPVVDLGNDTMVCGGAVVELDAGNPGSTYLWNTGETTQIIQTSLGGTYSVMVTSPDGCEGEDTIVIEEYENASVDGFNFVPEYGNNPGQVQFSPINPQFVTDYLWDFGDGEISNLASPIHTYTQSGDYIVSLTVFNECSEDVKTMEISVDVTTGIVMVKDSKSLDVDLYPNPAKELVKIKVNSENVSLQNVFIYNVLGQQFELPTQIDRTEATVQLNGLASGQYVIRVQTNKGFSIKKLNIVK